MIDKEKFKVLLEKYRYAASNIWNTEMFSQEENEKLSAEYMNQLKEAEKEILQLVFG